MKPTFLAALVVIALTGSAVAQPFRVGDRVDVSGHDGWAPGTVTGLIGGGSAIRVKLDQSPRVGPQETTTGATNVRPFSGVAHQPLRVGQRVEAWAGFDEWRVGTVAALDGSFITVTFADGKDPAERKLPKRSVHPLPADGAAPPAPGPNAPEAPKVPAAPAGPPSASLDGAKVVTLDPNLGWNPLPEEEPRPLNASSVIQLRGSGLKSNAEQLKSMLAPGGSVVGVVYEETSFGKNNAVVERADLRGRPLDAIALPFAAESYALSPSGDVIALAKNAGDFHKPRYELTILQLKAGRATPIASFVLPSGPDREVFDRMDFLADDRLLTHHGKQLTLWSLSGPRAVWTYAGLGSATLSADGKLVALASRGKLHVIDTATGDPLAAANVDLPDENPPAYLSPDRTRVMVIGHGNTVILNPATGNAGQTVTPNSTRTDARASGWISDRYAVINASYLLDAEQVFTAARFTADPRATAWGSARAVVGDRLVHLTLPGPRQPGKIATAPFLTPALQKQLDAIDPRSVWLLQPGDPVATQISTGDASSDAVARQVLQDNLARAGFVVVPDAGRAKATVTAGVQRSDGEAMEYEGRFDLRGQRFTVTPRRFQYEVAIQVADQPVWKQSTLRSFDPGILPTIEPGKSLQQMVDKRAKVEPETFGTFRFPRRLPRPEYRDGVLDVPVQ